MKNGEKRIVKSGIDDKIFSVIVTGIVAGLTLICLLPFINLLAVSLSGDYAVISGKVFLVPVEFTLKTYRTIIGNGTLIQAMQRTILLTIVYVLVALSMTIMCAYPLSVAELKGKKIILVYILITMYFHGGMIPSYLVVNKLGLIDSYLALILPCALSTYNMIVLRTFFAGIPVSLKEAALMDGAGDIKILFTIILPLSKPALATLALFYAVGRWNGMQDALLYINDSNKVLLQIRLKQILQNIDTMSEMMLEGATAGSNFSSQTIRAGSMMISLIPILIIYPFLQKYFVKGAMIGSIKG